MGELAGRVAIVTGAGRGIGRAIAERFASEGAKVALAARSADQLEAAAAGIRHGGGAAAAFACDVTDRAGVEALVRDVEARFGPLDVMVNNAGSFYAIAPAWEVDPEKWWRDVTINLNGVFLCCRAALPG